MTNKCVSAVCQYLTAQFPDYKIFESHGNIAAMPVEDKFILVTPLFNQKVLLQNISDFFDTVFTGSIASNVLTVESIEYGTLETGQSIYYLDQTNAFTLVEQLTTNTWSVTTTDDVDSIRMAAGKATYYQPVFQNMQLDIYGFDAIETATKIAVTICDLGYAYFKTNFDGVIPLKIERNTSSPFSTSEKTWLKRWILEIRLQYDLTTIDLTQQFFDTINKQVTEIL